jgi:hypothetical protein
MHCLCRRWAYGPLGLLLLAATALPAIADDGWNPFRERDREAARARAAPPPAAAEPPALPPMGGVGTRPWAEPSRPPVPVGIERDTGEPAPWSPGGGGTWEPGRPAGPPASGTVGVDRVERGELTQPPLAGDGSGLPYDVWAGLDIDQAQALIAAAHLPPRSPVLHDLWRKLWSVGAGPTGTPGAGPSFAALRAEALYRSGLVTELAQALKDTSGEEADPIRAVIAARSRIGLGDAEGGCATVKAVHRSQAKLPKPLRAELILLAGVCGSRGGDSAAAGLAADLIRGEGIEAVLPLAVLDRLSSGAELGQKLPVPRRATLVEYRYLALLPPATVAELEPDLVPVAEPALLAVLAKQAASPAARVLAAEAAARANLVGSADLAPAYRGNETGASGRPAQVRAILAERDPAVRVRSIRQALQAARKDGLLMPLAGVIAGSGAPAAPSGERADVAETMLEVELAAGNFDRATRWAEALGRGSGGSHWVALADIADPQWRGRRGASLGAVEQMALRGQLAPELMHRLVTVLDALDYQIPIPLWDAASRTPQPATGHLPQTGVLTQLKEAAQRKQIARTALLTMRTLGPDGAESAHMIALGDAIRALKRAGLEAEARRLGLEALLPAWPQSNERGHGRH